MSSLTEDSVEVSAASVDEAIGQALEQLGAQQDNVTIEVLSTPRSGVLGLGARPARVRVTRRAPEAARSGVTSPPPAPPPKPRAAVAARQSPPLSRPTSRPAPIADGPVSDRLAPRPSASRSDDSAPRGALGDQENARAQAPIAAASAEASAESSGEPQGGRSNADYKEQLNEAAAVLARMLELMGERAEINAVRDDDPELLELNIKGDGSGLLIGRHGQTLDALEYIVNRAIARRFKDAATISIDTESYRARRRGQLHRMALARGEEAKREHQAVILEPLPPRDRRIIHLALKDDPLVTTRSEGEGFMRSIRIVPVDARRDGTGSGDRSGRDRRHARGGGGVRSDQSPPPGQQGGFSRGQKRIV